LSFEVQNNLSTVAVSFALKQVHLYVAFLF
jgi:hypothetical protein